MTVSELIAALQGYPQDAEVAVEVWPDPTRDIISCEVTQVDPVEHEGLVTLQARWPEGVDTP